METTKDEVTITIKLSRNVNGTMNRSHSIIGGGIRVYEIIGLLTMICHDLTERSKEIAKTLPEGVETRPVYTEPEETKTEV